MELLALVRVLGECVAESDVLGVMAGNQHVRFTDRERFRVQLLTEEFNPDAGVELLHLLLGDRQHTAGAASRVVNLPDHTSAGQCIGIVDQEQRDDQPDHLTRCEVLPCSLVRDLREAPDEIFEQVAHLDIADVVGVQIDLGEPLEHLPEYAGIVQALELVGEQELIEEDVADVGREASDEVRQVLVDVARLLLTHRREGEAAGIVGADAIAAGRVEDLRPGDLVHVCRKGLSKREHIILGRRQDAIETTQHHKRQHDLAILRLLEIATEKFGDRPDETAQALNAVVAHMCLKLFSA